MVFNSLAKGTNKAFVCNNGLEELSWGLFGEKKRDES